MENLSRRNKNKIKAQQPVTTTDAFSNPVYRLGYGSQSPLEATEYPLTRMTDNYALLNSLYRDNWVVQNVVGIIPDDITKKWFVLTGSIAPEYLTEFERVQRTTQLKERINEGMRWGRLYGGAAGLILIRGQEGMLDQPLDYDSIMPGSFAGLYIVDRWCGITPDIGIVSDIRDPDFGLPEYYTINGEESRIIAKVHHSRIIRFTGRDLPFLEKMAEMYWGESEIEALYTDVVKHDCVSSNMAALTFRANIDTMKVQNLDQLFSITSTEQQRRFWNVVQAQSAVKSNFGILLVNKDDEITNTQYTFTGLQEVYDSMCLDLAGASRIPVTKLFGRSPAGMNATGESDLQNYYDYVDTLRESKLKPIIYKLLPVIAMSAWGAIPDDIDIAFPPLWTPTAKEVAEIAKAKAETIVAAFQSGLLDQSASQKELKKLAEETGMFDSISDEDIELNKGRTYQDVTALRDPLMGLGYGEELNNNADIEESAV
nr:MAG TPA: Portal [Caudoviricetes sp.]